MAGELWATRLGERTAELSGGATIKLASIACAGSRIEASGWVSAPFFGPLWDRWLGTQRSQLGFSCCRLLAEFLQLSLEGGSLRLFVPEGAFTGQRAMTPHCSRLLHRGCLVAPPLALGPQFAILGPQLVATLEQRPDQDPPG